MPELTKDTVERLRGMLEALCASQDISSFAALEPRARRLCIFASSSTTVEPKYFCDRAICAGA